MDRTVGIFPTPVMICEQALPAPLVEALIAHFKAEETGDNVRTGLLTHTLMTSPRSHEVFVKTMAAVAPKLRAYGETLLGEALNWGVKEIWINRMERDGAQKMHNHANSFISGVIYLTPVHDSAATVFHRHVDSTSFFMSNMNERAAVNEFTAPVYRIPTVSPGDLILFPSYVMHEVPPNQGEPRMTVAFNAVPERIDSWGYTLGFR
ncbi:MAG: 2OG-Fe(II) oxygenase family protein [Caulobacterales bacterium]|nr:2OG-Fe(II) oxygenase family protein [Caulobacterales bacterium]